MCADPPPFSDTCLPGGVCDARALAPADPFAAPPLAFMPPAGLALAPLPGRPAAPAVPGRLLVAACPVVPARLLVAVCPVAPDVPGRLLVEAWLGGAVCPLGALCPPGAA